MNKQKSPNYTDDDIDSYLETPWNIIESYFEGKHLKQMVRHQLESYNNFVIQRRIEFYIGKIYLSIEFIRITNYIIQLIVY